MSQIDLTRYCATQKTGRCANGNERDGGAVRHAVERGADLKAALCGATPGRRSAGWSIHTLSLDKVSCPRCLRRMASMDKGGYL